MHASTDPPPLILPFLLRFGHKRAADESAVTIAPAALLHGVL
jgi:hypothetical protein